MSRNNIFQLYLAAEYFVKIAGEDIRVVPGVFPHDLAKKIEELQSFCFITAFNPYPSVLNREENLQRNSKLLDELVAYGFDYYEAMGCSSDRMWIEDSFLVMNIKRRESLQMAEKYGQLAILYWEQPGVVELLKNEKAL
jgi:hypothetical protein